MAEAHQLTAHGGPLRTRKFLADAVGGKLLVTPAADFLGVGSGEHLGQVVDADAKAAGLADTIDAGEKFLRDEGAVVSVAGFEAVVARAAVVERERLAEVGEQLATAAG